MREVDFRKGWLQADGKVSRAGGGRANALVVIAVLTDCGQSRDQESRVRQETRRAGEKMG